MVAPSGSIAYLVCMQNFDCSLVIVMGATAATTPHQGGVMGLSCPGICERAARSIAVWARVRGLSPLDKGVMTPVKRRYESTLLKRVIDVTATRIAFGRANSRSSTVR